MPIPSIWVASLGYASVLSILCMGFNLTYLTSNIPNFAHGTYMGIGMYVSYIFWKMLNLSPYAGFPLAFLLGGAVGVLFYITVFRTLSRRGASTIVLTVATLAVQILLTAVIYIFAFWIREKYRVYTMGFRLTKCDFKIVGYPGIFPVSVGMCFVAAIVLHRMMTMTRVGVAMRAAAENQELAAVMGVNTSRIRMLSWFIAGGIASISGAMYPFYSLSGPYIGARIITTIFSASILGGLGSIYGALIGGFGLGLSEILFTFWLKRLFDAPWIGEYRPLIPVFVLAFVLLLEPRGLICLYERMRKPDTKEREERSAERE